MGIQNKSTLKSNAGLIKGATTEAFNTATRVGQMFEDIIDNADASLTAETSARQSADNTLQTGLTSAKSLANSANTNANSAVALANSVSTALTNFKNTKGQASGIAPLDEDGLVPSSNLPDYPNEVVEFYNFIDGMSLQMSSVAKSSTDSLCAVFFDTVTKRFVLFCPDGFEAKYYGNWLDVKDFGDNSDGRGAIPDRGKIYICRYTKRCYYWDGSNLQSVGADISELEAKVDGINIFPFHGSVYHSIEGLSDRNIGDIIYVAEEKCFHIVTTDEDDNLTTVVLANTNYQTTVSGNVIVLNTESIFRMGNALFQATSSNTLNKFYMEDEASKMNSEILVKLSYRSFINFNDAIKNWNNGYTLEEVLALCSNGKVADENVRYPGVVISFISKTDMNVFETWQFVGEQGSHWTNPNYWKKFGGGSAVGNCYNVTAEVPLTSGGYYDLPSAVNVAFANKKNTLGLQLTFAIAKGTWKTYQYVGSSTEESDFKEISNWFDLAGMSAGAETLININELCGPLSSGAPYTLATALSKLSDHEQSTGITYAKCGLVITYKVGENKWECKQFRGEVSDFYTAVDLWSDFGGSDQVQVEVTATPEANSDKAFSAGGFYNEAIVDFEDDNESEDGVTLYQAVTASGKAVGNPIRVPLAGSGGGSVGGTSLKMEFRDKPLYAPIGGTIKTYAAIRSTTVEGEDVISNIISKLSIVDTTTGITLYSANVNQRSSTSLYDFSFELDFTSFFDSAASRTFTIIAIDDEGNKRSKDILVTAVDATVTVTNVQTLHYTASSSLEVGGNTKSILLYKFGNNASDKGIRAKVEMFYDGEWKQLGVATITDSYSHGITINPNDVFGGGEQLTHGAYPLRVQGEDIASGVKGNMVYTAVMCVDNNSTEPIVAIRYNDTMEGTIRLYDTATIEVAAYTPGANQTSVVVKGNEEVLTTLIAYSNTTSSVSKQIQGFSADGSQSITFQAFAGSSASEQITLQILGSAIAAIIKDGAEFGYDFGSRSNDETDHTISNNGVEMTLNGCNWSSNGFANYLGENCLRVAENVTAEIAYNPFKSTTENSGMAVQFAFATNNIKDADAKLIECYDPASGAGFYVKGNKAAIFCFKGQPKQVEERSFSCAEKITMAVVVEPAHIYHEKNGTRYSTIKMYLNGEEVACIGYVPSTGSITSDKNIKFNGTDGDVYLYYMLAYTSHYEWAQAFQNYLVKLTDTTAMIEEYNNEQVLDSQNKPSLELLKAKGIPYYVVVADQDQFTAFDGDTNTSTKFSCTLFYYNPQYPCLNFKCTNVQWRRQGTTSAKRPVKNDRFYLNKPVDKTNKPVMTLLNPDDTTELGRKAIELAALNYTMIAPNGIPIQIITVKVDYSDSSNANDCGVCDMMNATFRAMGSAFMTPAQRAFDGSFTKGSVTLNGFQMDHSTKNHPIAVFRATSETLTDAYFHAKGNWKEDKGEQVALGFKNTPGYNLGCLNYGDFVEFFGTADETLDQIEARFKTTADLDTSKIYLLSLYCGRNYRFMRYKDGAWVASTGSMKQVNGKWQITGDVLNPVSGYELLSYEGMDWFQGVSSIEDMMALTEETASWVVKLNLATTKYPAWCKYFECMVDDDQLQIDLALGKKVPYDLYRFLRFCDECDYSAKAESVWKPKWKTEAWKYMSVESVFAYTLFTDYLAAGDQRAKNMQPMFFLEDGYSVTNGVYSADEAVRLYLNKVYDCDTCNGKDNDGGCTFDPEADPNKPTEEGVYTNPYAGWGSILFNNIDKCPEIYKNGTQIDDNLLNLSKVCKDMRECRTTLADGRVINPFSPEGAKHYFVNERLKFWPKLISSFDGERKYIQFTSTADSLYFYALQGLGLTALPAFIETRWRIRDGYYGCGQFFTGVLSGRIACSSSSAQIRFKAAKTGYFGIGNDQSGNLSESVFLEAGQSHTFTNFSHETGALLYIYQADRMSEIDLSEISLDNTFDFSVMKLAQKIVLGSNLHVNTAIGSYSPLTGLDLKDLPFLTYLDIRYTLITSLNASKCPRLETLYAQGSKLTSCSLAETSPVSLVKLPNTMTEIQLVNLPNLSYPGNLTFDGIANVTKLMVSGCPKIDATQLFTDAYNAGAVIKQIRLTNLNVSAPATILDALIANKAVGLDQNGNPYDESSLNQCSGLMGRWILTELVETSKLTSLNNWFKGLEVFNSQFSMVRYDDTVDDCENITNLDNNTGYAFNNDYVASGHFKQLEQSSHAVKGTYNSDTHEMNCVPLSDDNYNFLADGTSIDLTDSSGMGYDIFKHIPSHWYKGVNDYKNQKKYSFRSMSVTEPLSTSQNVRRALLSELLVEANSALVLSSNSVGNAPVRTLNSANNVYEINVEGMKQVRWPGINSDVLCCVFLGSDGKIISTFQMAVSNAQFDFIAGEDYIFTDVPAGAVKFQFTTQIGADSQEAIAVDGTHIEAIEPDWVFRKEFLVGVYGMGQDSLNRARSISGTKAVVGTGTASTSSSWTYDSEGKVTNLSAPSSLNRTRQDCINLCEMRGEGFHAISYEQSKDLANIIMELTGTRDIQAMCGRGCSAGYTCGSQTINGSNINALGNQTAKNTSSGVGNLMFGIQNFVACNYEWMDHVAVNVKSFLDWKAKKCPTSEGSYAINARWHIYDVQTNTEREVQGINLTSGYCIGRIRHGRFMDYVPSKLTSDNSAWNKNYSDGAWYTHDTCRVVGRAYSSANAYGGLVYSNAYYVSSNSGTYLGSRLAFSGTINMLT